ncbi:hypothetical protein SBI67_01140 [Mycolicibacterium sp. 120266]|uniref:hypothetical protein n=1 Tax=Mycolicibacterium sp. 120266 TaxID=3090601 RepID=UPI00299DAB90|nr:hypothetical protein [Mycolicibacterium sp. 120266]MDX1870713.1 hypothetical protein [Mycolicibacterium sp. 120266]
MSQEPGKFVDKVIGACFGVLLGVIALYCAGQLLQTILPTLIVVIGILALVGLAIGVVVVISTWRNRW